MHREMPVTTKAQLSAETQDVQTIKTTDEGIPQQNQEICLKSESFRKGSHPLPCGLDLESTLESFFTIDEEARMCSRDLQPTKSHQLDGPS
jgi:hypothetical protein